MESLSANLLRLLPLLWPLLDGRALAKIFCVATLAQPYNTGLLHRPLHSGETADGISSAQQFRDAYRQGKRMLENPKQREDGLRHLLLVLEHLEVTKDEKGAWWLANRIGGQTVALLSTLSRSPKGWTCRMPDHEAARVEEGTEREAQRGAVRRPEAEEKEKQVLAKLREPTPENKFNEDFPGEYDTGSYPIRSRIFREPQGYLCPIDHIAGGLD